MYTVYQIKNLINNKSYIGSSIRVEKRWQEHKREAFNIKSKKYNYPLYCDFRKYGLDNFNFTVLRDDFETVKEMQDYEHDMIIYYNSHIPNGYNQTFAASGGMNYITAVEKSSKKCAKVDIYNNIIEIYNSYHDAARANNFGDNNANIIREVCKGNRAATKGMYFRDLDKDNNIIKKPFKSNHSKKMVIGISVFGEEDVYFNSISEAAREIQTDRGSISKCVNGSTRYSVVHNRIWRNVDLYGNIIENEIDIDKKIEEYQLKEGRIDNNGNE